MFKEQTNYRWSNSLIKSKINRSLSRWLIMAQRKCHTSEVVLYSATMWVGTKIASIHSRLILHKKSLEWTKVLLGQDILNNSSKKNYNSQILTTWFSTRMLNREKPNIFLRLSQHLSSSKGYWSQLVSLQFGKILKLSTRANDTYTIP